MTDDHRYCPECGGPTTKQQQTEHRDMIEVDRTCDECPMQFTVSYGDPIVKNVRVME